MKRGPDVHEIETRVVMERSSSEGKPWRRGESSIPAWETLNSPQLRGGRAAHPAVSILHICHVFVFFLILCMRFCCVSTRVCVDLFQRGEESTHMAINYS